MDMHSEYHSQESSFVNAKFRVTSEVLQSSYEKYENIKKFAKAI